MYKIDMLPAGRGDALWIEYGKASAPNRVIIDGGIAGTSRTLRKRIEALDVDDRRFDLLIISHIDLDHIAGILKLIADPPEGLKFDNVLFNGWEQLVLANELPDDDGILGPKLGERLSARLRQRKYPWNVKFKDKLVAIRKSTGKLPSIKLTGGMTITLLSPTLERLRKLLPVWEDEIVHAGLKPGSAGEDLEGIGHPEDAEDDDDGVLGAAKINVKKLAETKFTDDKSEANGSSIAVMAEFGEKRCAFLGDAYSSDIAKSIARMAKAEDGGDVLEVNAVKLSHHGGRKNTGPAMLEKFRCRKYLVSTDGTIYDHPHGESLSRVLVSGSAAGKPSLFFNYLSDETRPWGKKTLFNGDFKYTPVFPDDDPGISVSL